MFPRYVVYFVMLVVSCAGQQMFSTYFRSVTWPNGTKLCALGAAASESYTTLSVVACSEICKKSITCGNFDFDRDSRLCNIYAQRPSCYGFTSGSCTHYEVNIERLHNDLC